VTPPSSTASRRLPIEINTMAATISEFLCSDRVLGSRIIAMTKG
jgi:hypothetical protein